MNVVAVVLVAGIAIIASILARRRGFSHNQRIVLSAIAVGLLLWDMLSGKSAPEPGMLALVGLAVFLLVSSLFFMRRQNR